MSDFGRGVTRKAAKVHRCEYCYGPIFCAESHYHYVGVYDGEWQNWRMHNECVVDYDLNCDGEFCPGEAPYPERVKALMLEAE